MGRKTILNTLNPLPFLPTYKLNSAVASWLIELLLFCRVSIITNSQIEGALTILKFQKVTKTIGLASLRSVLEEDAKFPASKSELIEKQGWKVFDLTEQEHVHASTLLGKLPDRIFGSAEEVVKDLRFL